MIPLCWYESGKSVMLGPESVHQTTKKFKMIQKEESTWVPGGSHVFLRVTPNNRCWASIEVLKAHSVFHRFLQDFAEDKRSSLSDFLGEGSLREWPAGGNVTWELKELDEGFVSEFVHLEKNLKAKIL